MRYFCLSLLIAIFLCPGAITQVDSGRERAKEIASRLPSDNYVRHLIEAGTYGDGVEQPWQAEMRGFGVKAATVEVNMVWFLGPRWLRPVRVVYSGSYDGSDQIIDTAMLKRIRNSGLESNLKAQAVRVAPNGHWRDLPFPIFWPFRAATAVTLWDDPWLPTPPHMFTTFGPGRPPLVAAVGFGDLADVDRLIRTGAVHRGQINEALWYACGNRDTAILQRLLRAGADVNQLRTGAEFGTCLMSAIWSNSIEAVKVLLAAGASVNGTQGTDGETPLILAASMGAQSAEIVKLLLDHGANVHASNSYGLTALMMAVSRNPEPPILLEMLIQRGADVNAADKRGRTVLAFAREHNNKAAIEVLTSSGAKN